MGLENHKRRIVKGSGYRWARCLLLVAGLIVIAQPSLFGQTEPSSSSPDAAETSNSATADAEAAENAATPPANNAPTNPPSPNTGMAIPAGSDLAIIPVEGMIYGFVLDSLERRVDRALNQGATLIVIELHTNGGQLGAALDIAGYIKTIPVPTVAWINNKAYSAGILIASACDQIVMSRASVTGDCAPIVPGQDLSPTERAKALSPLLEMFRDNARDNGYDYALFHAMCVLGIEVYQIENPKTGEKRLVNQADYAVMVQGRSLDDVDAAGQLPNPNAGPARPKAPQQNQQQPTLPGMPAPATPPSQAPSSPASPLPSTGNLNLDNVGGASINIATAKDVGQWRLIKKVHDGKTLLTLNQTRAQDVGLSAATLGGVGDLRSHLGAKTVATVGHTWSEELAGYLTNPVVRAVLIIAVLLGGYIEFQTPGLGVPGAVAAGALLILLGAPLLIGLAEIWHILLFLVGVVLLAIELIATPTFGLLGVAGIVMMFGGLVLSVVPTGGSGPLSLPPPAMWNQLLVSTTSTLVAFIISFFGLVAITKYFGQIPVLSSLVLKDSQRMALAGAATAPVPAMHVSGDESLGGGRIQVGQIGRVDSTGLRPTGRAKLGDELVDVVSLGSFIEPGTKVRVVEVHGNRIVVDQDHSKQ